MTRHRADSASESVKRRSRQRRRGQHRPLVAAALFGACLLGLAGCGPSHHAVGMHASGAPPASPVRSFAVVPASPYPYPTASAGAPAAPPAQPAGAPTASPKPSFVDGVAVACAGYPGVAPIVALLRSQKVISRTAAATAINGPLCAGAWQYTVLRLSGRDPLQAVTEGAPDYLALIAAGTDVCTPMVRTEAPGGILSLARC